MSGLEGFISKSTEGAANKPSISEAILFTVTRLFASSRLERGRLNERNVRGIVKVIGTQAFIRSRFAAEYTPFQDEQTGDFTYQDCDDRVLTAIAEGVITGKVALNGKNKEEIARMLQSVNGSAQAEEQQAGGIMRRYDR